MVLIVLLLSSRPPQRARDAGSRPTSLAQRDGDGLLPLPNFSARARAEGTVLVLAHHLADLAATLRGPPAGSPCRALLRHQWLPRLPLTCWPSERSARS